MSFAPDEYLIVARDLCGNRSVERDWRTAANRMYYGNFLAVRDALGVATTNQSVHKATIRGLQTKNRVFAQTLGKLKRLRTDSDYNMQLPLIQASARMHLSLAEKLMADMRKAGIIP